RERDLVAVHADRPEDVDAARIAALVIEARPQRVRDAVLAGQHDDLTWRRCRAVWPRLAARDPRAAVDHEVRLAAARLADDERELAAGQSAGPEPVDRLRCHVGQAPTTGPSAGRSVSGGFTALALDAFPDSGETRRGDFARSRRARSRTSS